MATPTVTFRFMPDPQGLGPKLNVNFEDVVNYLQNFQSSVNTPTQITADKNDYSLGLYGIVRLSSDASRIITGLLADSDGKMARLINVGSFDIVLAHQSASSSAANRIVTVSGSNLILRPNDSALVIYDATTARWRVAASTDTLFEGNVTSPAQITSNQNNYALGSYTVFRLSTDVSRTITGLSAANDGRMITIINAGSADLVLAHQSASSTAANRIITANAVDLTLNADDSAMLIYDNTTTRWRVLHTSDALWG